MGGLDDLKANLATEVISDWKLVDQNPLDPFAAATDDHQFTEVDPERTGSTPMGGTTAHGLLTLSLGPGFDFEMLVFRGIAIAFNYSYYRVRIRTAAPSGSRVRMRAQLTSIEELPGGAQLKITKCDQVEKPVCIAEQLVRLYTV